MKSRGSPQTVLAHEIRTRADGERGPGGCFSARTIVAIILAFAFAFAFAIAR
jgi:hypothetical protein